MLEVMAVEHDNIRIACLLKLHNNSFTEFLQHLC
jgi:hypothetical protein